MSGHEGILDRRIDATPVAVLDFETTGLSAGADRVIEVSVVRIEPGKEPVLAFDTLVCPNRRVSATDIHGITDEDVFDAPTFVEISGDLVRSMTDCVLAAYNVYFDIKFLTFELEAAGLGAIPPHLCLMYLRPLLGLGKRCSLDDACVAHGIGHASTHVAAADALASAGLWQEYVPALKSRNVVTFGDLADLASYKFIQSFRQAPFSTGQASTLKSGGSLKSRYAARETAPPEVPAPDSVEVKPSGTQARRLYWDALTVVLSDLVVTPEELAFLEGKKRELGLRTEEIRSLHARVFAQVIAQFTEDRWLDDQEVDKLHRLHACLGKLGWAPGAM